MPPLPSETRSLHPAASAFAGRDRVLLYTRGMNLTPAKGVTLALRSMRRAGENAPPAKIMRELFLTLEENNFPLTLSDEKGEPLVSSPPINRRPMIAEEMIHFSIGGALKAWFFSLVRKIRGKENR